MIYKWDTPHDWLKVAAKNWSEKHLYRELMILARKLDADTLQDVYQAEMEYDGYFVGEEEDDE